MEFKIAEYAGMTEALLGRIYEAFAEAEEKSGIELDSSLLDEVESSADRNVKIAFVGQYSAGKSSIIKMMTGNEDIAIGEGITTQVSTSYRWNGLEIVDTPGIATGFRKDHDEIAKRAIAQSDLLIFVITNEGFDSQVVENFKELAYDFPSNKGETDRGVGKINEILLVVNKMERMGNTPENQETLWQDICKALPLGEINLPRKCFISAKSYLEGLDEPDEEIKQELEQRSGYSNFISTLNTFANEKGFIGQLIAPAQQMEVALREAVQRLSGSTDNPNADAADAVLHQMLSDLRRTQRKGARELEDIFFQHASAIRGFGRELADNIGLDGRQMTEQEIEQRLKTISRECQRDVEEKLEDIFREASIEMREISESPLAVRLERNIDLDDSSRDSFNLQNVSNAIKHLGTVAKQIDKNLILKVGHLFKYKFKPWQATKLLKCMNKWIPIIGNVADLVMEFSNQKEAEEAREKLNSARRDTVASFNNVADLFEQDGRQFINEHFVDTVQDIIDERNQEVEALDAMKKHKSESIEKLKELIQECRSLQRNIRKQMVDSVK